MNKNILYIIGGLLIIGGVTWFVMSSPSHMPTANTINNGSGTTNTQNTTAGPTPVSIKTLLASGSQQCTFTDTNIGVTTNGTLFVSSGKMQGDFTTTVAGTAHKAHMIIDGTTMYSWVDGMTSGFKMNISGQISAQSTKNTSVDINKPSTITCNPWTVDTTKFQLPAKISFTDISAIQSAVPATGSKSTSSVGVTKNTYLQCGYCDTYTGDTRAQCRAALNCK
jgi:hypothetical protein